MNGLGEFLAGCWSTIGPGVHGLEVIFFGSIVGVNGMEVGLIVVEVLWDLD